MDSDDPFRGTTETVAKLDETSIAKSDFRLVVDSGIDAGTTVTLSATSPGPILLGQSVVCAVQLRDPRVSRRHLALEIEGGRVKLSDEGSSNGTTVRGVSVALAWLTGSEPVGVGDTIFHVEPVAATVRPGVPVVERFGRMIGSSVEMQRLYPLCERLARSSVPIVIEGETGTGKEILAETIHDASPRAKQPFIVFDCTTVTPSLAEAELFGHERGAFTGAVGARRGLFEQANGGTLFIDEIGDLDLSLQPKLLRAVERGEVRRIGGDRLHQVDIRIIAATRRNLDAAVAQGRFRDDLFHRLMVGRIELPPLRKRRGDITVLARYFWSELGGVGEVPPHLLARWEGDTWTGNVRSLRNAVARWLALGEDHVSHDTTHEAPTSDEGDWTADVLAKELPLATARQHVIAEFERRYIARLVEKYDGNSATAAAASGIARRYFNILRARHK